MVSRVSNKGQITLPAEIRRKLGIGPNSSVEVIAREGEIVIRPVKSIGELYGIFEEQVRGRRRLSRETERRRMEEAVAREVGHE
jgi:antitoxin PrlF